ncbi:MAG: hypothetical protein O7D33_01550 [Chloroflexi bacterium]|nr:hypothetical protein [Chloroflexota bacterium]
MAVHILEEQLELSNDMLPVQGTVDIEIPIDELWEVFTHANWWPIWNQCFFRVSNKSLVLSRQLTWFFHPIRWWYLYKMPARAKIVEVEEQERVTWQVTVLPGFYAQHTYHMEDLGNGITRFGSWEKAMGRGFKLMKWFWIPHFVFVRDRSLQGASFLEAVYQREGRFNEHVLKEGRRSGL